MARPTAGKTAALDAPGSASSTKKATTMANTSVIRLEQVGKVFEQKKQRFQALKQIDLTVESSEFVVIAGPSGSGKTTLLNLIGLLDQPSSGKLFFNGRDLSQCSSTELAQLRRDQIGFVFQAYNLMPVLTALENTEMVMEFRGMAADKRRAAARKTLTALGLGELMDRYPDQLSGGQQQRVAVARAVAGEPMLVIADEPTANLDSRTAESLMDLMSQLNREHGITFIFSSHDPRVISRAKRVISLCDGSIVAPVSQAVEFSHAV